MRIYPLLTIFKKIKLSQPTMDSGDIEKFGLLRYVRVEKLDIANYDNIKLGFIFPNGVIGLNKSAPLEEQVKTVLHEITHMHPAFMSYTGGLWQKSISRNEEYEERIEAFAQQVYRERKDVVEYVLDKIQKASSLIINL